MKGRPRIYKVNEDFFEQESKKVCYIVGITFSKGILYNNKIIWQSASKELLEIINSTLDSNYPIYSHDYSNIRKPEEYFTMFSLQIPSTRFHESLSRIPKVPKKERLFPVNIKKQYLDHFIRGIFDSQVSCSTITNYGQNAERLTQYKKLGIGNFGISFLQDLYQALVNNAYINSGKVITKPLLLISGSDVTKVYEFLYRDWEYIRDNGLYLPSKKQRFEIQYSIVNPPRKQTLLATERYNRAIDLLQTGYSVSETARILEFKSIQTFSTSFKKKIGKSPSKFKMKTSIEHGSFP